MERQTMGESESAAGDLRWYFTREATGPLRSNFGGMITNLAVGRAHREQQTYSLDETSLDDAARSGGVARVLRTLDAKTGDVLWRAFGVELPEEEALFGPLSAVAPITRAALDAYAASGSKEPFAEWMADLLARAEEEDAMPALQQIHREARKLRNEAIAAYVNQRRRMGRHV